MARQFDNWFDNNTGKGMCLIMLALGVFMFTADAPAIGFAYVAIGALPFILSVTKR